MKIHVPGFATQYVDEPAPVAEAPVEAVPVSVEEAIRLATERQGLQATQILQYTRASDLIGQQPLVDNSTATHDPGVNVSAALEYGGVPAGTSVPLVFDAVPVPTPPEGVLSPAVVPFGEVIAKGTTVGFNADELLK